MMSHPRVFTWLLGSAFVVFGMLQSGAPALAIGECAKYLSNCETLSSENYVRINTECASPVVPPCTEKNSSGGVTAYHCCKRTEGCKDACIAPGKCVSSDTQEAADKGGLDCPVGETCCVFSPKSSGSTEAAKEGAGGNASSGPAYTPESPLKTAAKYNYVPPLGDITLNQIVGRVMKTALPLIGALFLIMFIYGGFLWITAGGEEKQITKARQTLAQAFIGMVIVVGAYVIVYNLVTLLGGTLTGTTGK